MTRINTNVSALIAQQNLNNSNNMLQTTLTRLSTGLRINSAADDPAGMIAATDLGANIAASNQAISNSQVATQMISTADSALSQISSLLTTINGLVTESANTSSESTSQIAANQQQIDSSLNAINNIAQTTNFQGQNLLDGSLGFLTQGTSSNYATDMQNLQVTQANLGTSNSVPVNINVTAAATQATLTDSMTSGTAASATFSFTPTGGGEATGTVTIDAPTGGTQYNGTTLQIQTSANVAAGTAVATYNSTTNALVVTVHNSGTTSSQTIANAIAADTGFKIDSTTAPTGDFNAATGATSTQSALNVDTTDGGVLQISSKNPNSTWNGTNVQFETNGTSTTPNLTWTGSPGSGTLTIQVDATGTTSLATIAQAINDSTDPNISQLAATVTTAGNVNPAFDGNAAVVGTKATATYNVGAAAITLTALNKGLAANGVQVAVTVGGASTTASYSSTGGSSGGGLLTVNFAASGTTTLAALNTALTTGLTGTNADVTAFQNEFSVAATGGKVITGATTITPDTAAAASTVQTTTGDGTHAAVATNSISDGTNTLAVTLTAAAVGAAENGVQIAVNEAAAGTTATTATWNAAGGTGTGLLTITLGQGLSLTSAAATTAINTAIQNMTNYSTAGGFESLFGATGISTSFTTGSGPFLTASTGISAVQTTAGGTNTIAALGGAFAGGGISATLANGTGSAALTGALVMEISSDVGQKSYSFVQGTTAQEMVNAITQDSSTTGVTASINAAGQFELNSVNYGSNAYVNVNVVSDAGDFGSHLVNSLGTAATRSTGSDIQATVNNVAATGSGNTVSLNSPDLAFSATLTPGVTAGTNVAFDINGGGALFQLGAVVTSSQQARLGIQNVDTNSLGGGTVGYLYQIGSGQNASLTADPAKAGQIVQAALNDITSLRGQLGAFQTSTIDSNISTLTNAVTNLTAAQSDIQDADFATESAELTQQQILVQSGTTVLGIANSNPENVLTLLQKASQV